MNNKPPDNGRAEYPDSPCNKICVLNEASVCTGCKRSMDEIVRWSLMTPEEQWGVVRQLSERAL